MHKEILSKEQLEFMPLLKMANKKFGLVGGTAIALQIGHRRSIDFDFFSYEEFKNTVIKKQVLRTNKIDRIIVNKLGEFTCLSNDVKITFYNFPYKIEYNKKFEKFIKIPDLLTLAAMKAFVLGQRVKWKDYVDLYFIMKDFCSIKEIEKKAQENFKGEFNAKLFRMQLSYFNDVNYDEEVEYLPGFEIDDKIIKKELIKHSLS
jgi:hypothetical protein